MKQLQEVILIFREILRIKQAVQITSKDQNNASYPEKQADPYQVIKLSLSRN